MIGVVTDSKRTPKYWRDKAEEARAMGAQMTTEASQNALLRIADEYELLAQWAEKGVES